MSGKSILQISGFYKAVAGISEEDLPLCHAFMQTLMRCAAAVVGGAKPAALFLFSPARVHASRPQVYTLLRTLTPQFAAYGMTLMPVGVCNDRIALVLLRSDLIEKIVEDARCYAFLRERGFIRTAAQASISDAAQASISDAATTAVRVVATTPRAATTAPAATAAEVIRECRRRLVRYYLQKRNYEFPSHYEFPHEMGLLFGYPLEDVLGFIYKCPQTCCGPWCAYGDVQLACMRFALLKAAEKHYLSRFEAGQSIADLLAS